MNQVAPGMMPIYPHRSEGCYDRNESGFSLLEILIVLAIMGLMMTLVAPRLVSSIEAVRFARTADLGAQQISQLRAQAILRKQPVIFAPSGNLETDVNAIGVSALDLPEGWSVSGDVMRISATGLCTQGQFRLTNPNGQVADYLFTPPKCRPVRVFNEGVEA